MALRDLGSHKIPSLAIHLAPDEDSFVALPTAHCLLRYLGGLPRGVLSGLLSALTPLCLIGASAISPRQSFDVWRLEDGWQPNTVTAIVQSQNGYLWLGTYHGLVRFDGVRFTVFDTSTPGLQNSIVTSLFEDSGGTLWIGHETGALSRYAKGQFHPVPLSTNWPGGTIEAISSDENADLWLLNDSGVLFRLRDARSLRTPGGASPSRKAALARSATGRIWVVSNGLVASLQHGRIVPFVFDRLNTTEFYERVLPSRNGGLWVLGNGILRKWQSGRWVAELAEAPHEPGSVTTLLETQAGDLFVATLSDGVYFLSSGGGALHFTRTNALSHDWVRSLCADHEGNIWLGTGAGLDALRPRKVQMLNPPDQWQGCGLLSFSITADGSAWIGTEGAGLYHYDGSGAWTSFTQSSGVSNLFVWSVLETHIGDLFLGTWGGGLLTKTGAQFAPKAAFGKISAPITSMFEGKRGDLWIGTTLGLYCYESGSLTQFFGKEKLTFPDVRCITESIDGTIWFGMSGGGLGYLSNGVPAQIRKTDGLPSDFLLCLHPDADGALWFGTADHGLGRLKNGKIASIGPAQGLSSSVINHIVDDDAGNFWLGSHHGILRVSKMDLNRCADGEANQIACLSYGRAEGLASQTCSGGFQPGACRTTDGRLWFPTTKGLAIVDPANVSTNTVIPPVVIEGFYIGHEEAALNLLAPQSSFPAISATLEIPPGRQNFVIAYTALSYVAPDKVRFRYRLEGLENEWQEAGSQRSVQYSMLSPGKYLFRVIACNNDGFWNESGASLAFIVLPQFWQTWWFRVAAVASGASTIGAGVYAVSRRRERRKLGLLEHQRALERERARIARDIHDDLGASLTRITMLSQSVKSELAPDSQSAADVDQIYTTARELTRSMDEIVWAVNPRHDTLDSLVTYLGRFAQSFLSTAGIRCRLDVPVHLPPWSLTAEVRHNVFLTFKESLNNVVKHANASEVRISLELVSDGFKLIIADNGRGFDPAKLLKPTMATLQTTASVGGNGLANMQKRMEEIEGSCEWITAPQEGTRVKLSVTTRQV